MAKRLENRVALVFGAGSVGTGWGNGKASAVAYARAGAKVVAVDWRLELAEETRGIVVEEGGDALAVECDVTRSGDVKKAVEAPLARYGRIDILHNNVGHAQMGGPIELTEEDWDREIAINCKGIFLACKHVLPVMLKQGKGAIVNISSSAGLRHTGYDYPSYYLAKGGVNQLTVGLGVQYARAGIRVNAICPGLMDTPLIYQQISGAYGSTEEMVRRRHEASPTGRMGTAWDVANAAVFLASDEAQYINAVVLPVDGGLTARCA